MKLHAEDMPSLLAGHALQSSSDARDDHNDAKQLPLDQTDNIDGKYRLFVLNTYTFIYI